MNELWGHLIGVVIVLLMLSFIGIWIWAWLPRHRKTFDSLAQIPMEDPIAGPPLSMSAHIPANRGGATTPINEVLTR